MPEEKSEQEKVKTVLEILLDEDILPVIVSYTKEDMYPVAERIVEALKGG